MKGKATFEEDFALYRDCLFLIDRKAREAYRIGFEVPQLPRQGIIGDSGWIDSHIH